VYVAEAAICEPLNRWIATLSDPSNRGRTVQAMVASQSDSRADAMVDAVGDIGRALDGAEPQELLELYASLRVRLVFDPGVRPASWTCRFSRWAR